MNGFIFSEASDADHSHPILRGLKNITNCDHELIGLIFACMETRKGCPVQEYKTLMKKNVQNNHL